MDLFKGQVSLHFGSAITGKKDGVLMLDISIPAGNS
jgi:hypothetical protein